MASYRYNAIDQSGQRVNGMLAGASERAVLMELESRRLTPIRLQLKHEVKASGLRQIPVRRLAGAYQQLADLLKAGVPLLRAIKVLSRQKSSPRLADIFRGLADAVEDGDELSVAMSQRPEVFSRVHIAMVRAGEKGGFLEEVLDRLGSLLTAQADLRSKVIGNLIYPLMLIVFGMGILSVIFGVFVPMFKPLFERLGDDLPTVTRFVFASSALVGQYGLWTLSFVILLVIGFLYLRTKPSVARNITWLRTFSPVIGPLTRSLAAARFCRLLGTLEGNGVPLLAAMKIARDAANNVLLEEAIDKATEAVQAGQPLAPPLAESGLFEEDVIEMIAVAEAAANLDKVLVGIAETIESRIDRMLSVAVRLLEPLLLMALAGVVVIVAAGLILPMAKLSSAI